MLGLYPVAEVRAAEEEVMSQVPEGTLMQRASCGLATECARLLHEATGAVSGTKLAILVGAGNNGGDALFAGAKLQRRGVQVQAYRLHDRCHEAGARALVAAGGRIAPLGTSLQDFDLILDGIVGIGAHGPLRDPAAEAVSAANRSSALRVAVDLPSGIDADSGVVLGDAVFDADATVTFGCLKRGLVMMPGRRYAGRVRTVDIGLGAALPQPTWQVLERMDVRSFFPEPDVQDYKYRRGVVGIAAGSARYVGAALLSVGGARYTGVGMTTILDRRDGVAHEAVRTYPDVVTTHDDPRTVDRVGAWVCGPGLTGDPADSELVATLLQVQVPLVLDAGALTVVARDDSLRTSIQQRGARGGVTVLTPHAGEFRMLFGDDQRAAMQSGAIVVRKGPSTQILAPDGRVFIDTAGSADLSCAGSGDVLAGLVGGVLAHAGERASAPPEATVATAAATWMHGVAGRWAGKGRRPVLATDLVRVLPDAIAELRRQARRDRRDEAW
jgi:hydroxyethylthiazole kinase-like uncharacterized protein yjeF